MLSNLIIELIRISCVQSYNITCLIDVCVIDFSLLFFMDSMTCEALMWHRSITIPHDE